MEIAPFPERPNQPVEIRLRYERGSWRAEAYTIDIERVRVESGTFTRREQHVLEIEILMMSACLSQGLEELYHRVENHDAVIVISDFGKRDGEVMAIRDFTRCNVRASKYHIFLVGDVSDHFRRADTARTQAKRRDELTKPTCRKNEEILAHLRHPSTAHVVSHNDPPAAAGKIHGEHRRASHQWHRIWLPSRVLVQSFRREDTANACSAAGDGDDARFTDLEALVRWNRKSDDH